MWPHSRHELLPLNNLASRRVDIKYLVGIYESGGTYYEEFFYGGMSFDLNLHYITLSKDPEADFYLKCWLIRKAHSYFAKMFLNSYQLGQTFTSVLQKFSQSEPLL